MTDEIRVEGHSSGEQEEEEEEEEVGEGGEANNS